MHVSLLSTTCVYKRKLNAVRTLPVLAGYVVVLADELVIFEHVQFLTRRQLFPAYHARETVEVKNFVSGFPHQIGGRYALGAAVALFPVPPANT